jgi:PAS domain S-box-containing protein
MQGIIDETHSRWNWLGSIHRYGARTPVKAALVCFCCYLGSAFDAAVVFPQIGTAILFPSYAVLTAALLFSPARHWWIYLLASALGNYIPHRYDSPASWVLLAEAANFIRALLAAGGIRYFDPDGPRLDTFRGAATFLAFAVAIGPIVGAFLGSGVVVLHTGAPEFWLIWQAWFLSNALTALTLLPIIVIGLAKVGLQSSVVSWRFRLETSALFVGLLAVGALVFAGPYTGPSSIPARIYAPLPFLLWAAVRLGVGCTSAALLVITALTIWGAGHGQGPFVTQSPAANLLSLQLFLLAISSPTIFLAAALEERSRAFAALAVSEQEVRRQYAQLATIYREAPVGLAFTDTHLRYVGVNNCMAEINGATAEAHLGRTVREVLPQLAETIEPIYRRVLATGEPIINLEIHSSSSTPSAFARTWMTSRYPVKDAQGALLGVCTVAHETTERKQIEDARQELAHSSRLTLVGELTASIAHEINQPLGAILSNADAAEMLLEASPVALDELGKILDDIRKDAVRASEVIRRLRKLLRKREKEMQQLDFNEAVTEVLALIHGESGRRGVVVEKALAAQLPLVRGDKVQLQQILLNLCLNGMEAMVGMYGAKKLTVSTALDENADVEIAVVDAGSGIAPDRFHRLFEPFFSTKNEGMGLGLSIARSLVEAHGGRIWAENNPCGGTIFRFRLPAEKHRREDAESKLQTSEVLTK